MDWFGGLRVLSLESRRADEMKTLIEKYGGVPTIAPSMREQKLDLDAPLAAFERSLLADDVHALACMTGVGTRIFLRELTARDPGLLERLQDVVLFARGTKPLQALKEFGLKGVNVDKPHTWREISESLMGQLQPGQHAILLEYGESPPAALRRELHSAGLRLTNIPVYRTTFPLDTGPLERAVWSCIRGEKDVLLLASGTQALHFLKYAEQIGVLKEARAALNQMVIVSIGPACSEVASDLGLRISLEANPHKMGILVRTAAEHATALVGKVAG